MCVSENWAKRESDSTPSVNEIAHLGDERGEIGRVFISPQVRERERGEEMQ